MNLEKRQSSQSNRLFHLVWREWFWSPLFSRMQKSVYKKYIYIFNKQYIYTCMRLQTYFDDGIYYNTFVLAAFSIQQDDVYINDGDYEIDGNSFAHLRWSQAWTAWNDKNERAGGREPEAEGGENRRNLKCEATFRTCAGWAQPSQKNMFEPCRVLKKNPLLTRLRTTPGCWKVFGSGALYHSCTKCRRMLDSCQRVLRASGPDPPEPQKAHSRKRDARGPQDLSCEPSCGGAHITFLVNVSRKNTMTTWSPPDRTTRKPPGGSPRCVCAMPRAKGHNGLVSVPKPACAKPTRRGTHTRRRICRRHCCDLDRFESILYVLRCLSSNGKPSTGKWCRRHRQEMLLRVLMLHRVSRRPRLQVFTWKVVGNHQTSILNWFFEVPGRGSNGLVVQQ